MDVLTRAPQLVDGRIINDLPPHIVRLARMIARDCARPGDYVVSLTIPDRAGEPMRIQTARIETIRRSEADRK